MKGCTIQRKTTQGSKWPSTKEIEGTFGAIVKNRLGFQTVVIQVVDCRNTCFILCLFFAYYVGTFSDRGNRAISSCLCSAQLVS